MVACCPANLDPHSRPARPAVGALRHSYGGPWQVFRRVQLAGGREEYALIGSFEEEPKAPQITEAFRMAWAEAQKAAAGA